MLQLQRRAEQMKKNLEQQEKELEEKIKAFEAEREAWEEQNRPDEQYVEHLSHTCYSQALVQAFCTWLQLCCVIQVFAVMCCFV